MLTTSCRCYFEMRRGLGCVGSGVANFLRVHMFCCSNMARPCFSTISLDWQLGEKEKIKTCSFPCHPSCSSFSSFNTRPVHVHITQPVPYSLGAYMRYQETRLMNSPPSPHPQHPAHPATPSSSPHPTP